MGQNDASELIHVYRADALLILGLHLIQGIAETCLHAARPEIHALNVLQHHSGPWATGPVTDRAKAMMSPESKAKLQVR